jgi:hypothetical protein
VAGVSRKALIWRLERGEFRRFWYENYASRTMLSDLSVTSARVQLQSSLDRHGGRHVDVEGRPFPAIVEALEAYVRALARANATWRDGMRGFLKQLARRGAEHAFISLVQAGGHPEFLQQILTEYLNARRSNRPRMYSVGRAKVLATANHCSTLADDIYAVHASGVMRNALSASQASGTALSSQLRDLSDSLMRLAPTVPLRIAQPPHALLLDTLQGYFAYAAERQPHGAINELMSALDPQGELVGRYSKDALRKRVERLGKAAAPGTWISMLIKRKATMNVSL